MWWGDGPPVRSLIMAEEVPHRELHHYRGWKQCQHLPLDFGEQYASGLTVYLSSNFTDVISIVSHGPSDSVSVQTEYKKASHVRGIPFHFAFSPREYLSSAWLHLEPRSAGTDRGMIVVGFILALDKFEADTNFLESPARHKPRPSPLCRNLPFLQTEKSHPFGVDSSQRWNINEDSWTSHEHARIDLGCT